MCTKKHILFLSPWYPDKKDPMPGLFVQRHALASKRYNEVAALFVAGYPDQTKTERVWSDDPLPELRYYCRKSPSSFGKIRWIVSFFLLHFRGLNAITKRWGKRPDVVHVNVLTREGVIALLWKWRYGIPFVITEHWSRYHNGNYKGTLRKFLTKLVLKNAEAAMPVSEHLKNAMLSHGLQCKRYQVIPNVVDTDKFVPGDKPTAAIKQILHVSCFDEKPKNIRGIIDVVCQLAQQRSDFKLVLVGDGPDFQSIKAYAMEKKHADRLFDFRGLLEGDDVVKAIQASDFHLMFSRYENLPVVNLECLACGIPVVSSDVGGIKEHLNPKLGRLVPSEDEEALLNALNFMLDHVDTFDKSYIRQYAVDHFSEEAIGKAFTTIYSEAIK